MIDNLFITYDKSIINYENGDRKNLIALVFQQEHFQMIERHIKYELK